MLRIAVVFLVIALVAAMLGFAGVASLSWAGVKILFMIFVALVVLTYVGNRHRGQPFWY